MTPRQATFATFLSFGVSVGLWSGSVPVVAAASSASPALLGAGVTCGIAGSILGIGCAGLVARHVALRHTLPLAVAAMAVAVAAALQAGSLAAFLVGFSAFGLAGGLLDGTMNAEGLAVERALGRPVLAGFHAACSFASALAAGLGGAVSVRLGTGATGLIALVVAAAAAAAILRGTPLRPVETRSRPPGAPQGRIGAPTGGLIGRPILLLGLVAGIAMACEAAATMFAASTIREQAPGLATWAGFGAGAFLIFQAGVRARIDAVRHRVADADLVILSILVAGIGCLIVATGAGVAQSAAGFAVIGIGTAAVTPCVFALASRVPGLLPAQAIGLLSLISALPRVPQPIGFGAIAARWGFATGYALNGALMLAAFALALRFRSMLPRQRG
jgi:hypothetical protein